MPEPTFKPMALDDRFTFQCHQGVPCFNHCCRDLNQALTPYDVLMLRQHLKLSFSAFVDNCAEIHAGPASGLPVVGLRFEQSDQRRCPFVTDAGCRVYTARPSSCRLYPVARALSRSPDEGRIRAHFALLQEPHCRGFEQGPWITVEQWIADQQLAAYFQANDALLEIIALKNRIGKGPLPPTQQQWVQMALYDLDALKQHVAEGRLVGLESVEMDPPSPDDGDGQWLDWGMVWIKHMLALNLKP